jgi:phosphoglycerate kinase
MQLHTIDNLSLAGHRALIRVDFNVPLDKQYQVTDDSRIRAAVPTIRKILADGGSVVLMSHLGRPLKKLKDDGSVDYDKYTLRHVVATTSALLGVAVQFAADCVSEEAYRMSAALQPRQVLLLENLRFYKEEEKGGLAFAQKLSQHGDVYVNDAFGTAHRAHASTAVIAQYYPADKRVFGYVMANEIASAERVLSHGDKPFTAIIGGAKVSDKILLIDNLIDRADHIIIGGGMAYTFYKAMGGEIGSSLLEVDRLDTALAALDKAKAKGCKIHLPVDSLLADKFDAAANTQLCASDHIPAGWMGLDIGTEAITAFSEVIRQSKTILWNGPMGVFEMAAFQQGTVAIARAVAEATSRGAFSLVGGGDSVAAVNQFGLAQQVSYVSTGGGAMLEYFEGKTLPGIQAIMG